MQVDSDQDDIGGFDNTDSHSLHDQVLYYYYLYIFLIPTMVFHEYTR